MTNRFHNSHHKNAEECLKQNIRPVITSPSSWECKSQSSPSTYHAVQVHSDRQCTCTLKCTKCRVCAYAYTHALASSMLYITLHVNIFMWYTHPCHKIHILLKKQSSLNHNRHIQLLIKNRYTFFKFKNFFF